MREPTKTYHRADVLWGKANQTPSIVEAVQFHGINITKHDALVKEVAELYRSNNLDQLVHDANLAAKHLQEVGLMEHATALIDTAQSKQGYIVNFVVKEPKPFTFGVKAGMSTQGDADLSLNAAKQSCFGRGESINASYSNTIKGDHSFSLNFIKPFLGWQKYSNFTMSLYRSMAYLPWNQSNLDENAVVLQYNGQLFNKKLLHSLKMNSVWRTLRVTDDAAFVVREFSGHTMKFSFENSVAYDTRDRPLLATRGLLGKWSQEYAGPLGDHHFLKNQWDFQASTLLFKDVILALSLQVKTVNSLGSKELHLLERAYLGGNQELRGFGLNTVGVRADNSCLGGGAALAGVFHLYKPLFPPQMLYAHAWLAGGSIASVRSKSPIKDMLEAQRSTAGIGLAFVFKNIFRLELNYVHPILTVPGDSFTRGLHIGAGVNFI